MENHVVWLTKREVAEIARVHVRTVERAIANGKLRASKPNGSVRIRRSWMNAWLASALVFVLLSLACVIACSTIDAWADLMMRAHCPLMQFVD